MAHTTTSTTAPVALGLLAGGEVVDLDARRRRVTITEVKHLRGLHGATTKVWFRTTWATGEFHASLPSTTLVDVHYPKPAEAELEQLLDLVAEMAY